MRGAEDMFRLAPLVARLLCSALPGFKAFLWLLPRMRYAFQAMQASIVLAVAKSMWSLMHLLHVGN
jgi:hypothetical protein